jgi:hypothetical protein
MVTPQWAAVECICAGTHGRRKHFEQRVADVVAEINAIAAPLTLVDDE